ncbi:MAG: hypothetical protein Q9164_005335, partial [Protoblastenia rupestris]
MAVEYKDLFYHQGVSLLRSDVATMETILSARDVELANLDEDHDATLAEVEELQKQLKDAEGQFHAQGQRLKHATNKARIAEKVNEKLRREKEGLQTEKETLERDLDQERTKTLGLERENKCAARDVGFFAVQNAFYRHEMEDSDPARTALFDGIIQRKEEAIIRIERDLEACHVLLAEEKKGRAVDNVNAKAENKALRQQLEDRTSALDAMSESREGLQEQMDKVAKMFKAKIYHDDMVKAICDSHDAINHDNAFLIAALQKRDNTTADAFKETARCKAEIIELSYTNEANKQKHAQTESEKSQLIQKTDELEWKSELHAQTIHEINEAHKSQLQEFTNQIRELQHELNALLHDNLNHTTQRILAAKDHEIHELQVTVESYDATCKQFYNELLELGGVNGKSFSFRAHYAEIQDWRNEDLKRRLKIAEGRMVPLQVA